jgi:hypothetical protein
MMSDMATKEATQRQRNERGASLMLQYNLTSLINIKKLNPDMAPALKRRVVFTRSAAENMAVSFQGE